MDTKKLYDETIEILNKAMEDFRKPTNNQQGMPEHLMKVSRLFGEAKDNIRKLEKLAKKQSLSWRKTLNGNNNNNNNSNNKTKKRKRSASYNSYFNNTNNNA